MSGHKTIDQGRHRRCAVQRQHAIPFAGSQRNLAKFDDVVEMFSLQHLLESEERECVFTVGDRDSFGQNLLSKIQREGEVGRHLFTFVVPN